jgi:3-methyladenine DNA glycosylase/8-oxoguanine DNA glycosylase
MQAINERKPSVLRAEEAVAKLVKSDATLAKLIAAKRPFELHIAHMQSTFETLAESIVYQQLTGKAAATIFNRLKSVTHENRISAPDEILALPEETIRGVGLSRAKTLAIIDLARRTKDGLVPEVDELDSMSDEDIVRCLTTIRGIGPWSVEMLLIFRLGRLDVMPATDYGVRKGFALTYKLDELPTPKQLMAHAEKWRPYRSIASWYMWRALEIEKIVTVKSSKSAGKSIANGPSTPSVAKSRVKGAR